MNELLIWTLAAVAVAIVLLLWGLGQRRQRQARAEADRLAQAQAAPSAAPDAADDPALREVEDALKQRLAEQRADEQRLEADRARADAERLAREQAEREAAQAAAAAEAARLAEEAAARDAEARRLAQAQAAAQAEAERLAREQAEREAAEAAVAAQAASAAASRELRADETLVLVADDSKIVRVKISRLLTGQSYRVALAESGEQALELLAAERPHVVITDVEMPGIDGFELTRRVRATADWADLPVLMITSSDDKREQADAAGVTQLLGKPYSEEALLAAIERARLAVRVPA